MKEALEYILKLDERLFIFLNSLNSPEMDTIMSFASGKTTWIPFYILLLVIIIWRFKTHGILIIVLTAFLVFCTDRISVVLFKDVFERLRPCHALSNVHLLNNYCGGQFGFVSSHAANCFGVTYFLTNFFYGKFDWLKYGLFIWAILVSYSRIYSGVHYPLDVIGGAFLGMFLGQMINSIYFWFNDKITS